VAPEGWGGLALIESQNFGEGGGVKNDCGVAQAAARRAHNPEVAGSSPAPATNRGYFGVGLYNPKQEGNCGAALRACGVYGASFMAIHGQRFKQCRMDTMKAWRHLPVLEVDSLLDALPFNCVPVAVELVSTARSLVGYTHPERAFYLFGPEDGSLPKEVIGRCRDTIYVPTNACMNLAACVNVVLYDRMAKALRA
jgi:tRNA(Leu) C34 or U34 (ribose-2'-O)-methylase TrmL